MLPALVALAAAAAPAPPVTLIPAQPALRAEIAARDSEFFDLYFLGCDPARLRTMITPDVEFYHDKGGFAFRNAEAMAADYRSRRALVAASLTVDPVPGHGAIETGEHLFYERKGDGPEKLVGRARFAIVWKRDADGWKLSRALSYAHAPAGG